MISFIYKNRIQLAILVVVCLLTFANAFTGGFISDDIPSIVANPAIGNLGRHLTHLERFSLAAVLNTLIYRAVGLNSTAYHIPNILLHLVNTILVYILLHRKLNQRASLIGALIFTTHPIAAEAVSWISGRQYLIRTFLILTSLLAYLKATHGTRSDGLRSDLPPATFGNVAGEVRTFQTAKRSRGYYTLSLLLFAGTLYGAEDVFSLGFPLILVLLEWQKRVGPSSEGPTLSTSANGPLPITRYLLPTIPFFLLSLSRLLSYCTFQLHIIRTHISDMATLDLGAPTTQAFELKTYLLRVSYAILENLKLILWPQHLTLYHDAFQPRSWAPLILIPLAAILIFTFLKLKPVFLALAWFFLFLGPTFSPIPVGWLVAERYLYLPSLAWAFLLALGYHVLRGRLLLKNRKNLREALTYLAALLIAAYSIRTIIRNQDWEHRDLLWAATLRESPHSRQAHINMGDVYATHQDWENAIREFQICIQMAPAHPHAYHNLANVYAKMGEYEKAIAHYHLTLERDPYLYQSHEQLGLLYLDLGDFERARAEFEAALEINLESQIGKLGLGEVNQLNTNP